jgi:hypothetical protein
MVEPTGRHVRGPDAIQASRTKTPLQPIGRNRKVMTTVCRHDEVPSPSRTKPGGAHQSRDPFAADPDASIA